MDTRTYNATCIGCSLWLSRRRHRPAQDKLVCLVPPVLPIWLLADLPPDLEGAPHRRPPAAAASLGRATPADQPAAAAAAATKQDEAGHDGSSRTCHLRSNHRAADEPPQAVPRGRDPLRQARRPLPGHGDRGRHLHLAARQTRPATRGSEKHALAALAVAGLVFFASLLGSFLWWIIRWYEGYWGDGPIGRRSSAIGAQLQRW